MGSQMSRGAGHVQTIALAKREHAPFFCQTQLHPRGPTPWRGAARSGPPDRIRPDIPPVQARRLGSLAHRAQAKFATALGFALRRRGGARPCAPSRNLAKISRE